MQARRDVVWTRQMIEGAYYELLFQKSNTRITVKDILEAANISRGTFYAHYKDIPDLAEQVENGIVQSMIDTLSGVTLQQIIADPRVQVERILSALTERRNILAAVLSSTDNPKIIRMMKTFFIRALAKERLAETQLERVHIIDACVAGTLFDACLSWMMDENPLPKEELIETISAFLSGGLDKLYNCGQTRQTSAVQNRA